MRTRDISRWIRRALFLTTAVVVMVVFEARAAQAQYIVQFYGPAGKTSGFACSHMLNAGPGSPTSTSCWSVVVWYKGTYLGFNNYAVGGEAAWTNSYACPSSSITHWSTTEANNSQLFWIATIIGPGGYISRANGAVNVNGGLNRNLALSGIDPSKCNA